MNQSSNSLKYKCIFFDLDHTLWDYETNSRETLLELYQQYDLLDKGIRRFEDFHEQFRKVNTELWYFYDRGMINSDIIRKERFKQILSAFHAYEERLSEGLSHDYLNTCPLKGTLMPHARETLEYLSSQYDLTIITNGFEEIQNLKLKAGNLHQYFGHVITSQKANSKKPSKEIFDFALTLNGIAAGQAMMIGDNLITDIGGARNAAIDAVYYNPEQIGHQESVYHEITSLAELRQIL
jgi:YjjG family noncanonical pyrimidine nucleotidase